MCNPFWSQIKPVSTLTITAKLEGLAHVDCQVTTSQGEDGPDDKQYQAGDFPISLPLKAGTLHRAQVNVTSLGEAAYVTIAAIVTGADSRGPDVCRLEVDANHPYAFEVIIAEARNA